jgi:hypothetical protein
MSWSHGATGYKHHGCRCQECRAGHAAEQCAYRARRMERTGERMLDGRFTARLADQQARRQAAAATA